MAREKYGKSIVRPQDEFDAVMVAARRINFGMNMTRPLNHVVDMERWASNVNCQLPSQPLAKFDSSMMRYIDCRRDLQRCTEINTSSVLGVDFEFYVEKSYDGKLLIMYKFLEFMC